MDETFSNTPGTRGCPGGRDRTLAVKIRRKPPRKSEVGQKQKTEREYTPGTAGCPGGRDRTLARREREKDRKFVITMAKLCMAHASTHGARKPPGPKKEERERD